MANGSHLFKKGNQAAKGNGKPKTRARHRIDVAQILESEDFCPFREAVRLYRLESTKTYARIEIINSLQKYVAPTLKAVDLSNKSEDDNFQIIINTKKVETSGSDNV